MKSKLYLLILSVLLSGCDGALGNVTATDPAERGLSYIAAAIITHALISLFRS